MTGFGLALFAVVIAALAVWDMDRLKAHLHLKDQISTKKWRKAANSPRFQVSTRKDDYPLGANPSQIAFFVATAIISERLNKYYSDSPWSFDDEGKLDLDELDGAKRSIAIRHGQQKTGLISFSAIDFNSEFDFLKGEVTADLEIMNARFWPFHEVYGIAITVAQMIADVENFGEARYVAAVSALECMWMIGPEAFGNPDFEFTVSGRGLQR